MKTFPASLAAVMGTNVSGDIGLITFWTRKDGQIVFTPKRFPDKPPSPRQLVQRARVSATGFYWRLFGKSVHRQWAQLVSGADTCLSPFGAFMACCLNPNSRDVLRTCARQAGLNKLPPHVSLGFFGDQ